MNNKKKSAKLFVFSISCALILGSIIAGIIITVMAMNDAGLSFWDYAMLNKLGVASLIWNFNPVAYVLVIASTLTGVASAMFSKP